MKPTPLQRFGLLVSGVLFVALFAAFAVAQGIGTPTVPAGDVALVENVPGEAGHVSEARFHEALVRSAAQGGEKTIPKPGEEHYEELKETALQGLIDAAWIQGEAAEMGIATNAVQLAAEFKAIKAQNFKTAAEYKQFLKASHYTKADIDEKVKLQLLSTKVQEAATNAVRAPSSTQVAAYYETAKSVQFTQPPRYDIRLILNVDKAKILAAKAALEEDGSAASWEKLAKRYSEDPTGKSHGGLHKAIPAEFGEPLDAAIAAAAQGAIEGPVEVKKAFFVFRVEKTIPEEAEPLAKVRSHIVAQLEKQNREEAFEDFVGAYTSKWRSRTVCAPGYVIEHCASYTGTGHPQNAPAACYEAHPKAGIAAPSCPAPVSQLVPALPGTVSILTPKGTALPQGPQPQGQSTEISTNKTRGTP
jgi:foldase protein PrsA